MDCCLFSRHYLRVHDDCSAVCLLSSTSVLIHWGFRLRDVKSILCLTSSACSARFLQMGCWSTWVLSCIEWYARTCLQIGSWKSFPQWINNRKNLHFDCWYWNSAFRGNTEGIFLTAVSLYLSLLLNLIVFSKYVKKKKVDLIRKGCKQG